MRICRSALLLAIPVSAAVYLSDPPFNSSKILKVYSLPDSKKVLSLGFIYAWSFMAFGHLRYSNKESKEIDWLS
jgi:hypothetical protein